MSDPITRLNAALEGRYEIERELGPRLGWWAHADPLLEPLWDYPPFQELLRPKG